MNADEKHFEYVRKLERQRDELVEVLKLIHAGLENGSIKSKPIIAFNTNAESCDMQPLEVIISALLSRIRHSEG